MDYSLPAHSFNGYTLTNPSDVTLRMLGRFNELNQEPTSLTTTYQNHAPSFLSSSPPGAIPPTLENTNTAETDPVYPLEDVYDVSRPVSRISSAYIEVITTSHSRNGKKSTSVETLGPVMVTTNDTLNSIANSIAKALHCHQTDIDISSFTFRHSAPKNSKPLPFGTEMGLGMFRTALENLNPKKSVHIVIGVDRPLRTSLKRSGDDVGGQNSSKKVRSNLYHSFNFSFS